MRGKRLKSIQLKLRVTQKYLLKHKKLSLIASVALAPILLFAAYSGVHNSYTAVKDKKFSGRAQYNAVPEGQLKGLEKDEKSECKKHFKVNLPEKSRAKFKQILCSHGPDTAQSLTVSGASIDGDYQVPCYGDGASGNRVQALYVVASDKPDRYDQLLPNFRKWAGYVDTQIDKSAQKTGSHLHAKWQTESGCQLSVAKVVVPPDGDDDFGSTIAAVKEAGFNNTNRKYLMWVDDNWYCGIGTMVDDDRKDTVLNANNAGPSYSRVDTPCWGNASSAELHELFHNLGAVQESAPHATQFGHCTDGYDVMCYKDSSTTNVQHVCPSDQAYLLDCNNDDYLNSHPPDGSYLAGHWNTFDSGFLFSVIPTNEVPPTTPTNLTAKLTYDGIALNWSASTDDEGKQVTYKIYRGDASAKTILLTSTTATTHTDRSITRGTFFNYFVVAYDPSGNASSRSATVSVYVPSTPVPAPDTTPPPAVTGLSASDIATQGFKLNWNLPANTSDIKNIVVLLNDSAAATLGNTASSANLCCGLQPDTSYTVRVKTVDAAGNSSLSSQITVKTLPVTSTSTNVPYNLALIQVNGAEVTLQAKIDTTVGAWFYRVTAVGASHTSDFFLPVTSTPSTRTFVDKQVRPQDVTGYYIAVFNSSNQEIGRSATLPFNFTGSAESNPPSAPTNFRLSNTTATSTTLLWDASSDDSGKVYTYRKTLTNNSTGVTSTLSSGYDTSAGLSGLQSGTSYTAKVRAEDIWGNLSPEATYTFTFP